MTVTINTLNNYRVGDIIESGDKYQFEIVGIKGSKFDLLIRGTPTIHHHKVNFEKTIRVMNCMFDERKSDTAMEGGKPFKLTFEQPWDLYG
jgi:hypothetical protein